MISFINHQGINYYSLSDLKLLFSISNNKRLKQDLIAASGRDILNRNKVNYVDIDGVKMLIYRAKYKTTTEDKRKTAEELELFLGIDVAE